jgi:hypothetical protein
MNWMMSHQESSQTDNEERRKKTKFFISLLFDSLWAEMHQKLLRKKLQAAGQADG